MCNVDKQQELQKVYFNVHSQHFATSEMKCRCGQVGLVKKTCTELPKMLLVHITKNQQQVCLMSPISLYYCHLSAPYYLLVCTIVTCLLPITNLSVLLSPVCSLLPTCLYYCQLFAPYYLLVCTIVIYLLPITYWSVLLSPVCFLLPTCLYYCQLSASYYLLVCTIVTCLLPITNLSVLLSPVCSVLPTCLYYCHLSPPYYLLVSTIVTCLLPITGPEQALLSWYGPPCCEVLLKTVVLCSSHIAWRPTPRKFTTSQIKILMQSESQKFEHY